MNLDLQICLETLFFDEQIPRAPEAELAGTGPRPVQSYITSYT